MPTNPVRPAVARNEVQARFPDGRYFNAPVGTALEYFAQAALQPGQPPIVAMLVDGILRELAYPLMHDADLTPVDVDSSDGLLIYRRSLVMLLAAAASEIFPNVQLSIEHSLYSGGYFGRVRNRTPFTGEELAALEAHMRKLVEADEPVARSEMPLEQAIAVFEARGDHDKARLLRHRTVKNTLIVYRLRNFTDYYYGYKVPSTGYLQWFGLQVLEDGFGLRFPRRDHPGELPPLAADPNLLATFERYNIWLQTLNIDSVGALNDAIEANRISELSLVQEALHEAAIAELARQIVQQQSRVVLISGPTASGKTTFSKRLAVQLLAQGVRPLPLAMDDWFVNRAETPRDAEGEYDFEALEAVDIPQLNADLLALMRGEAVVLPQYNFFSGAREAGETLQLQGNTVLILEGIHGLNPALTPSLRRDQLFRIYVSALTALNLDHLNRVSTTDMRLVRRMVRDAQFRGYGAADTLARWERVRDGERKHIFPYQPNADVIFNSAIVHELSVLRPLVEPLLLQVRSGQPEHVQAKRLQSMLQWFKPAPLSAVPDNSLLREFTGGSILGSFRVWRS